MERKSVIHFQSVLFVCMLVILASGCSRDPAKAKVKYLESGKRYMQKGELEQATLQFQNALKQDPRFVDAFVELGRAYLAAHDAVQAHNALQQALLLDSGRLDARLVMGQLYLNTRRYPSAQEQAALIVTKDAVNAKGYELMGVSLASQSQSDRAVEAFAKVVELQPNDATAYINLATALITLKRYPEADADLRKAIQLDPHSVPAYMNLANLYRLQKNVAAGEQVLQQGADKNPGDTDLNIAWAEFLYAGQKKTEADTALNALRAKQAKSAPVALAIGDFYFDAQETEKALAEFRRGLQIDGKNVSLQNHLVDCLLSAGRLDEAEKMNDQTLRDSPKDLFAGIARGRILLARKKSADAVAELQSVVTRAQDSPSAHYVLALAYRQDQKTPQAKAELQDTLKIDPGLKGAQRSLAQLEFDLGENAEARDMAEKLARDPSANAADHVLLGNIYLRQKEPAKAREQFLEARAAVPGLADAAIGLAQTYVDEHKLSEARNELEQLLTQQPQLTTALTSIANILAAEKQQEKAMARVKEHLGRYPDDAGAHILMGRLFKRDNRLDAAAAEFSKALELDPKLTEASIQLGGVYQQAGQVQSAIQQFEKVLQVQPQDPFLQTLVADLYVQQKNRDLALKHYQQALAMNPNFYPALNNLAAMYADEGANLDVALGLAQKAKQLQPDSPVSTDTLGWIQYKKGLYAGAVPLFQDCVAKSPESALFHYHLGAALFAGGDKQQAKPQLQMAMRLKLASAEAEDARRILTELK